MGGGTSKFGSSSEHISQKRDTITANLEKEPNDLFADVGISEVHSQRSLLRSRGTSFSAGLAGQARRLLGISTAEARFNAIIDCRDVTKTLILDEIVRRQTLQQNITGFLRNGPSQAPNGFNHLRSKLGCGSMESDWGTIASLHEVLDEELLHENPDPLVVNIVEPWEHVGHNTNNEEVRASVNLAYFAKSVGLDSHVIPLWKLRCGYPALPSDVLVDALIRNPVVFEGGAPDVYDESTFHRDTASRDFLWLLFKRVLLARHRSQMCIFICLSHQMVASTLNEIVKDAICDLSRGSESAQQIAKEIAQVGNQIQVTKDFEGIEQIVATGFYDEKFATAENQDVEAELLELHNFNPKEIKTAISPELRLCLDTHAEYAKNNHGIVEEILQKHDREGERCKVAMFHGNEVNWEAVVFINWALSKIFQVRDELGTPSWIKHIPVGVEITSSTLAKSYTCLPDGRTYQAGCVMTEVASMRIDYLDEFGFRHSSYSCQFHPELTESLRDARFEMPPKFNDLRQHHGQQMLAHFLQDKLMNQVKSTAPTTQVAAPQS